MQIFNKNVFKNIMAKQGGKRLNAGRKKRLPANFKRKQIAVTCEMFLSLKQVKDLNERTCRFWESLIDTSCK